MIFSVSAGSDGGGEERYLLYAPFVLGPGWDIGPLDAPFQFPAGSYDGRMEKLQCRYCLSLGPFTNEKSAVDFVPRLKGALLWSSLRHRVGLRYPKEASEVRYYDEQVQVADNSSLRGMAESVGWEAVDGNYDADRLVILADHKRLTRWETGNASVRIGINSADFAASISEALAFDSIARIADVPKLQLAIELYGAFSFEVTDNTQFITLVTSLEALIPDVAIPKRSIQVLGNAKDVVRDALKGYKATDPEREELARLSSRIGNLKNESIGHTLRQYVVEVARRTNDLGDPCDISARLKHTYDVRSALLHDGVAEIVEIRDNLAFLRDFLPKLLSFLFREEVDGRVP